MQVSSCKELCDQMFLLNAVKPAEDCQEWIEDLFITYNYTMCHVGGSPRLTHPKGAVKSSHLLRLGANSRSEPVPGNEHNTHVFDGRWALSWPGIKTRTFYSDLYLF